jgi:hypothetical protein
MSQDDKDKPDTEPQTADAGETADLDNKPGTIQEGDTPPVDPGTIQEGKPGK